MGAAVLRRLFDAIGARLSGEAASASGPSQGTVLVVDDDGDLRELVRLALQARGLKVLEAGDGEAGVRMADASTPDLIVLDAMMPVLDGFAALKKLKERRRTRAIPVVMLTARSRSGDVVVGIGSGAEEYLTKPLIVEELLQTVDAILRQRRRR